MPTVRFGFTDELVRKMIVEAAVKTMMATNRKTKGAAVGVTEERRCVMAVNETDPPSAVLATV